MNLNIRDQEWIDSAACGSTVDDWLWHDHGDRDREAALKESKKVCGSCPVRDSCLEYALADPGLKGIWAATTSDMRREMRRKAALQAELRAASGRELPAVRVEGQVFRVEAS